MIIIKNITQCVRLNKCCVAVAQWYKTEQMLGAVVDQWYKTEQMLGVVVAQWSKIDQILGAVV